MADDEQRGIDYHGLYDRVGGDKDFAHQLVAIFLYDCPIKLREIEEAIERSDATHVEKVAHSLKGTAATIKAKRFEAIAFELEAAGRNGEHSPWQPLLQRLLAAFDELASQADNRGIGPEAPRL